MINELISVIIPTYKRSSNLARAIHSVLQQTYPTVEVIIVDDNNPDTTYRKNTQTLIQSFLDNSNVIYHQHPRNLNGSTARNTGLSIAKGQWICFLDDDDYFLPNKLAAQITEMYNHPHWNACCCDCYINNTQTNLPFKTDYTENILLGSSAPQTSGIMFKKDAILKLHGFDTSYTRFQDYELMLRFFAKNFKMGKINQVLYVRGIDAHLNAPRGSKLEPMVNKFCNQFQPIIEQCERHTPGIKNKIYVNQYVRLSLCYIKEKDIKNTIRTFKKSLEYSKFYTVQRLCIKLGKSIYFHFMKLFK